MKRRLGRGLGSLLGAGGLAAVGGAQERADDGGAAASQVADGATPSEGKTELGPGAGLSKKDERGVEPREPEVMAERSSPSEPVPITEPVPVVVDGVVVRDGGHGPERAQDLAGHGAKLGTDGPGSIPHAAIRANPYQPRIDFDEEALEQLCQSLKAHGFLQPLCVRRCPDQPEVFELISGERRWRAAGRLGMELVPVTIRPEVDDGAMLELALVENLQREDLNAMERARALRAMQEDLGLTQEKVAKRVGMRRATVANHLRLLELPKPAQDAIERGLISMGHGRALLGLSGEGARLRLLGKAVREELSVRALEEIVRRRSGEKTSQASEAQTQVRAEPWIGEVEGRLRERLGTKAVVRNRAGYRGSIQIDYHDREELDRLLELLAPAATL
ncbi:MAG: ParB/RepB/Spo0J family partition protein [Planctomycetota bacterium]|nr:ParB/RepB/Spo0J family partition protein [Planctomycetota bacterium]MDP6838184.1 ParB/RepB/Spo0J family partition protein [Planctomycetota bacterium]